MKRWAGWMVGAGALALLPSLGWAHFKLLEPPGWVQENNLGDPQKLGPCGGTTPNPGTVTNIVTKAQGGQKLHIKLQETVFHPGHYRIALAVHSRAELPPDPDVKTRESERGPWSVSSPIASAPLIPVLADGLFVHTEKVSVPLETDVVLPNITCEKCTLQIIQFMAEHGFNKDGGYFYHHCADLQITADPAKVLDTGWH